SRNDDLGAIGTGMMVAKRKGLVVSYHSWQTLNRMKQTTLAAPVSTKGIGLHTAVPVTLSLAPAPPDTGYVFRRTDLGGFEIPATVESVAPCSYATTLM